MKISNEHSSLSSEILSVLENTISLSQLEVNELKRGEEVYIMWEGRNGPHKYVIEWEVGYKGHIYPAVLSKFAYNNEVGIPVSLDFVGQQRPFQMVWKVNE